MKNKTEKVRWGVLGVASIAVRRAIPAMQRGRYCEVTAMASRERSKAEEAARTLGVARAYGSYKELLADPEIDAVYIPLPNHLHAEWTIKAAEAGKHVLCEKPLTTTVAEARTVLEARQRTGVKIGEAFMVRTHPRWLRVRELVRAGRIGRLRSVTGVFSYFNRDAANTRNRLDYGGGALLDIGCYPVTLSRFLYGEEPSRVVGSLERDPEFGTDRVTSALLEFPTGQSSFVCGTQLNYRQRMELLGTDGRIEIELPFTPPPDQPTRIVINDGSGSASAVTVETIPSCDQFTAQGDAFSLAIREDGEVPVSVEDAIGNMAALEAILRSEGSGKWERP